MFSLSSLEILLPVECRSGAATGSRYIDGTEKGNYGLAGKPVIVDDDESASGCMALLMRAKT